MVELLQFSLFGPVRARDRDTEVALGPLRRRCVLAALLTDANRGVPPEELVERVWGPGAPREAGGTLRSYVSRLRGALSADDSVLLERSAGGYRLTVDEDRVDLHLFRSLTAEARLAEDDGERARLLRTAVDLGQGELLGELDTPWAASIRTAVSEELLTAEIEYARQQLDRGHGDGLARRLTELAARHPLDERVAAQLLRGLCWEGRTADALWQFESTRQQLADELGVSPGDQLAELHLLLLKEGAGALAPTPRPTSTRTPAPAAAEVRRPRQLPPAAMGFVGREAESAALDALLTEQSRSLDDDARPLALAVISGPGGAGKTALAVHWAQRVKHRFPDGQLHLNLRGFGPTSSCTDPSDALAGMLRALGIAPDSVPADEEERTALLRSELDDKRMLILLDNARDSDQVRPLLPGGSSLVVVTSRRSLRTLTVREGGRAIALSGLATSSAVRLLLGDDGRTVRDAAERATAEEIVDHCAGLPLALRLCADRAARLPHRPLSALARELADRNDRLRALSRGESPETDLDAVFTWSYEALAPQEAELFLLLGAYPGRAFGIREAAALGGTDEREAAALLGRLADAHLVEESDLGRYEMHDLLHQYAHDRARRSGTDTAAALRRLTNWYAYTAQEARLQLSGLPHRMPLTHVPPPTVAPEEFHDAEHALTWFDASCEVVVDLVTRQADKCGAHDAAIRLCHFSWTYFYQRGNWHDMTRTHEVAAGYAARSGETILEAKLLNGLSTGYGRRGLWQQAVRRCEQALAMVEGLGDEVEQATSLLNLGAIYNKIDRCAESRTALERAMVLFERDGDTLGVAMALNNLAGTFTRTGELDAALDVVERALATFVQDTTEPMRLVAGLGTAASVHAARGEHEAALQRCRQALAAAESTHTSNAAVGLRVRMGEQLRALGRTEEALAVWQEARELSRELGDRNAEREIEQLVREAGADAGVAGGTALGGLSSVGGAP